MRAAAGIAEAGLNVLVLEEDTEIGDPVECAGLVSPRVVSMTETDAAFSREKRAEIIPPSEEPLVLRSKETKAVVMNRESFDKEMAEKAIQKGTELKIGARIVDVDKEKNRVLYRESGEKKSLRAKIIIGADGANSIVRRKLDLDEPEEILAGIQAVVGDEIDHIKIYMGREIAPSFFAWEMPHPAGGLVGIAGNDGRTYERLQKVLKMTDHEEETTALLTGSIPIGDMQETVEEGFMLVGDAACQVKPLSGGGLYPGLKSADICAEVVKKALAEGDLSKRRLNEYHKRWKKEVGKEISRGLWMRRAYKDMTDEELDDLVSSLNKDKIKKIIQEKGDIDHPSTLAKPILKSSPKLLKFTGPLIKKLF